MIIEYSNQDDFWFKKSVEDLPQEEQEEVTIRSIAIGCMMYAAAFLILYVVMLLASCTTPKVLETVRTDTVWRNRSATDSIFIHDSVVVAETHWGDTVRLVTDRWHTRWRDRVVHDTTYVSNRDTVAAYANESLPSPITGWQHFLMWTGRIALAAIACAVVVLVFRRWLRTKRLQ